MVTALPVVSRASRSRIVANNRCISPVPSFGRLGQGGALPAIVRRLHDLPVLFLCDTPGMMVGPGRETALVPPLLTGCSWSAPITRCRSAPSCCARPTGSAPRQWAGGSFHASTFAISWPTGEFGGMGFEGRRQARLPQGTSRRSPIRKSGAPLFGIRWWPPPARGKALSTATYFEGRRSDRSRQITALDRDRLAHRQTPPAQRPQKRPNIDTW